MDAADLSRFTADLDRLLPAGGRLGVAVSGGPDSLALLILTAAARPGSVDAATVDHGLRVGSGSEAQMVAEVCGRIGVPHAILPVEVASGASLQAHARAARYAALGAWANARNLRAVLTGHHADDQAETLLMRLARGAGLAGLAGVRARRPLPGGGGAELVRPLLGWRKADLGRIAAAAGLQPVDDPANADPRHDRTRVRAWLREQELLDPLRLGAAAGHLGEAEEALTFAADLLFAERAVRDNGCVRLEVNDLPRELRRRLLVRTFAELGADPPRGPEIERALQVMEVAGRCTLGGLLLEGGASWTVRPEPPRR